MKTLLAALFVMVMSGAVTANEGATPAWVPLNPGETILETHILPGPIVQMPMQRAPIGRRNTPPPFEIDRVTGRPRNQAGWSGNHAPPAATACFPEGAC